MRKQRARRNLYDWAFSSLVFTLGLAMAALVSFYRHSEGTLAAGSRATPRHDRPRHDRPRHVRPGPDPTHRNAGHVHDIVIREHRAQPQPLAPSRR